MYTDENMNYEDSYEENNEKSNYENNNGSIWTLLGRILIIFLCLLLIIWIVSKFVGGNGNKKYENNGMVLNNNLDTIRLAGEKYFFLEDHLPVNENDTISIGLGEMNAKSMVSEIKDYQDRACSVESNESYITIKKTNIAYELIIKLTCSSEQKEITYYYDLESQKCLSCDGRTYMNEDLSKEEEKEPIDEEKDEKQTEIDKLDINCKTWSPWTSIRINDSLLAVRTRTLVRGYRISTEKYNTIYGPWSAWSETPISEHDDIEIEQKEELVSKWSENKTTTSYIANSKNIKVISAETTGTSKSCTTSYKTVRDKKVSAEKYYSLNKDGLVIAVHDTYYDVTCGENCKQNYAKVYDITYKKKTTSCIGGDQITTYTYQELGLEKVMMYRYRTVSKEIIKDEGIYTDWVEKLSEGYVKIDEKIEYSYKDTSCKG